MRTARMVSSPLPPLFFFVRLGALLSLFFTPAFLSARTDATTATTATNTVKPFVGTRRRTVPTTTTMATTTPAAFVGTTRTAATTKTTKTRLSMATWSDAKAVQEYQNFLASGRREVELKKDAPSVIVRPPPRTAAPSDGNCPYAHFAEALYRMGNGNDVVITPEQEMPNAVDGSQEFPVYVCLPPYRLHDFLSNLLPSYKAVNENFVFFAGGSLFGNVEDVLKDRGYCRDSMTQVLISGMEIKAATGRPIDVHVSLGQNEYGEPKLAGECAACGKWHGAIASRLGKQNIRCSTDFYRDWRRKMWERSVYDAAFYLLGAIRDEPTTILQVAQYYETDVSDLVWDLSQLLRGWKAITLMYGFEERMFGFAEMRGSEVSCQDAFADPQMVTNMFPYIWGNFVYLESQMFVEYLQYAQNELGIIPPNIELPSKPDDGYVSKMRKGNLRADGAL